MESRAHHQLVLAGIGGVLQGEEVLELDERLCRSVHGGKDGERAVAGGVDHLAPAGLEGGVQQVEVALLQAAARGVAEAREVGR